MEGMIYSSDALALFLALVVIGITEAFKASDFVYGVAIVTDEKRGLGTVGVTRRLLSNKRDGISSTLMAMGKSENNDVLKMNMNVPLVNVRFINTRSGKDVITNVPLGANLLTVGDQAGISLPRACRTGLCGSCTCEVKDPAAIDGYATIRACSANVFVPSGESEMIVDVYRMREGQVGGLGRKGGAANGAEADDIVAFTDPMARFAG